jgi:hypothetical protein
MTLRGARSLWTVLTVTVVGLAASLVGCASTGPTTPVAVSDVKSLAGKWAGLVYGPGSNQHDYIEMTIREDGSYDLLTRRTIGTSRGKGKIVISDGRLIVQGEKGRGVAVLMSSPGGERVMKVEATLNDNTPLSASLSPTR